MSTMDSHEFARRALCGMRRGPWREQLAPWRNEVSVDVKDQA